MLGRLSNFSGPISKAFGRSVAEYVKFNQFGAEPYYKPLDGRLEGGDYYPTIAFVTNQNDPTVPSGYTKITSSLSNTFTSSDLNKKFVGIGIHKNPSTINYSFTDDYYPNEISCRYSNVTSIIDDRNILVDFEYNGGNITNHIADEGKGYIFKDNSFAFKNMQTYLERNQRPDADVRLDPWEKGLNFTQKVYVVPEYESWTQTKNLIIWSGTTSSVFRLKLGFEDYYQLENYYGTSQRKQDENLIYGPNTSGNEIIIYGNIIPPHKTIKQNFTFKRNIFTGRSTEGVYAYIEADMLVEKDAIEAGIGLTVEEFQTISISTLQGGTITSGTVTPLTKVEKHVYNLIKNVRHSGQTAFSVNYYPPGAYIIGEDSSLLTTGGNVSRQEFNIRLKTNNPYEYFDQAIQDKSDIYLPYTFEIDNGNFFKTWEMGGTNRLNYIAIQCTEGVATFQLDFTGKGIGGVNNNFNGGIFGAVWEYLYNRDPLNPNEYKRPPWDWVKSRDNNGVITSVYIPRTATCCMLIAAIPVVNEVYRIGRHYADVNFINNNETLTLQNMLTGSHSTIDQNPLNAEGGHPFYNNPGKMNKKTVKTLIVWSTILEKTISNISLSEVPANSRPLNLQPGDIFEIVGQEGVTYSCVSKQRLRYPSAPEEYAFSQTDFGGIGFPTVVNANYGFYLELNKDLPDNVGATFEIRVLKSISQEILDGQYRPGITVYAGNDGFGSESSFDSTNHRANMTLNSTLFQNQGDTENHLYYTQVEVGEWYKNMNFGPNIYRCNTNSGAGFSTYDVYYNGVTQSLNPIARYCPGKTLINCIGPAVGQWGGSDGGTTGNRSAAGQMERVDFIQKAYGQELPESQKAKVRLYNSPTARTASFAPFPGYYEYYPTDQNAPDMPTECRAVLTRLGF